MQVQPPNYLKLTLAIAGGGCLFVVLLMGGCALSCGATAVGAGKLMEIGKEEADRQDASLARESAPPPSPPPPGR